jgi:hypothetical protein
MEFVNIKSGVMLHVEYRNINEEGTTKSELVVQSARNQILR